MPRRQLMRTCGDVLQLSQAADQPFFALPTIESLDATTRNIAAPRKVVNTGRRESGPDLTADIGVKCGLIGGRSTHQGLENNGMARLKAPVDGFAGCLCQ